MAAKVASATFQEPTMALSRCLKPESEILDRISARFARMLVFNEIEVHSYFEELPMGKFSQVNVSTSLPEYPVLNHTTSPVCQETNARICVF